MKVTRLGIPEVLMVEPDVFTDARGLFSETWNEERYAAAGIHGPFVQDNLSISGHGVVRGLHFQWPVPQAKLVQVLRGEVFDVAVDLRRGSPTFGRWVGGHLSAEHATQMYIPEGFAHGFQVTSDEALVTYKCTAPYRPEHECTVAWDDPTLAIPWPIEPAVLSGKDRCGVSLSALPAERQPLYAVQAAEAR